jgi:hypothetical protein
LFHAWRNHNANASRIRFAAVPADLRHFGTVGSIPHRLHIKEKTLIAELQPSAFAQLLSDEEFNK